MSEQSAHQNAEIEAGDVDQIAFVDVLASITEVFFHCGKALIRSKIWDPSGHVARDRFPSLVRIVADQTAVMSAEAAEQFVNVVPREIVLKAVTHGDVVIVSAVDRLSRDTTDLLERRPAAS